MFEPYKILLQTALRNVQTTTGTAIPVGLLTPDGRLLKARACKEMLHNLHALSVQLVDRFINEFDFSDFFLNHRIVSTSPRRKDYVIFADQQIALGYAKTFTLIAGLQLNDMEAPTHLSVEQEEGIFLAGFESTLVVSRRDGGLIIADIAALNPLKKHTLFESPSPYPELNLN